MMLLSADESMLGFERGPNLMKCERLRGDLSVFRCSLRCVMSCPGDRVPKLQETVHPSQAPSQRNATALAVVVLVFRGSA